MSKVELVATDHVNESKKIARKHGAEPTNDETDSEYSGFLAGHAYHKSEVKKLIEERIKYWRKVQKDYDNDTAKHMANELEFILSKI